MRPIDTTPSRKVPEHIEKPNYVTGKSLIVPTTAEVKDLNQLRGMKRSCKLAFNILAQVHKIIMVRLYTYIHKFRLRLHIIISLFTCLLVINILYLPTRLYI